MWEFLPLVAIVLLFWLLVIRPAQRRQRAVGQLQRSLEVGDEVMLTSGFFGTVRALHDDRLDLELAEGITVAVARGAIASTVTPASAYDGGQHDDIADDAGLEPDVSKEG